jgi:FkbM family methyltransferase
MSGRMLDRVRRIGKEALLRRNPGLFWWYVRMRHGHLEPEMAMLHKLCLPGSVSVDIGANYGIYSYYMARFTPVVAFEPFPDLARLLREGLGKRVQVHEVALSNRSGSTEMVASLKQSGHNTIEPTNRIEEKVEDPSAIVRLQVPVRRLDDFALERVGFIKIDVEGHEQEVLAGGEETIRRSLPALVIEVEERHREGSTARVLEYLGALGYRAFYAKDEMLLPAEGFDRTRYQNPQRPDEYIRNFVFLPEHRVADFREEIRAASQPQG